MTPFHVIDFFFIWFFLILLCRPNGLGNHSFCSIFHSLLAVIYFCIVIIIGFVWWINSLIACFRWTGTTWRGARGQGRSVWTWGFSLWRPSLQRGSWPPHCHLFRLGCRERSQWQFMLPVCTYGETSIIFVVHKHHAFGVLASWLSPLVTGLRNSPSGNALWSLSSSRFSLMPLCAKRIVVLFWHDGIQTSYTYHQ